MPAANIEINAVAVGGADVPINVPVQLSNADVGGETTYAWTVLDQPEGAADALSNPAIENPTITPRKEGTYRLRLVVNAGQVTEATDYAVLRLAQVRSGIIIPAAGEILESDTVRGWATRVNRDLQVLDAARADSNLVIAGAGAGVSVGSIVHLDFATRVHLTGLPGEFRTPEATLALAATRLGVSGPLGIVVAVVDGTGIAAGKAVLVRMRGLVEFTEAGAPTVGDFVLVDNAGEPTLSYTAPTHPVIIGRVSWTDGVNYRWVITPSYPLDRRVTTAIEGMMLNGSATWLQGGEGTAAIYWVTTDAAATGLHYALKVNVGETLYRLEADVIQNHAGGLITAYLSRGSGFLSGTGEQAAVAFTTAATGEKIWNIQPGAPLILPQQLTVNEAFWLNFRSSAQAGQARSVGNVTAYVRPT